VAEATLIAGTTSGTATVTATLGTVSTNTTVVSGGGSVFPTLGQTGRDGNATGTHKTTLTADAGATDATSTVTVTISGDSTASESITLKGVSLTSSVQPDTILANGSTTATFTWQASETTSGAVISNHDIIIAKVSGPSVLLSNVSTSTNASGSASATVTSTTNAGDLILKATLGGVEKNDTLHLLQDQFSVDLATDNATLLRDGSEAAILTATVSDRYNDPVVGQRVDFALTGSGTLNKIFVSTDVSGQAKVTLTSDVGSTNANAQIIASVSTVSDTLSIPLYGVTLSIKAVPTTLVADNSQESSIEVTVKEAGSNTPLVGRLVTFAVSPGAFATITAEAITDTRGIATATLTADTTASFTATVTGRLGSDPATTLTASTSVNIIAHVVNVSLTASSTSILRDGSSTSILTARVIDDGGNTISGKSVDWGLTGSGSLSDTTQITDSNGQATATFKSDAANSSDALNNTIRVTVDDSSATATVDLRGITLTAAVATDQDTIIGDDSDSATITATLIETTGRNPVVGKIINFTTDLGTVTASATTNDDGKATATLKGTSSGTATVTAKFNDTLSATATVIIIDQALTVSVAAADTTLLRDGVSTTTVTVTVTDNDGTAISGRDVDWGLSDSSSGSLIDTTQTTDSNGQTTATFKSDAANSSDALNNTIRATVGGSSATATVDLRGITITVVASPDSISANGQATTTVTAFLKETTANVPLVGKGISFDTDLGTIARTDTTGTDGKTTVTFTAGTSTGTATVTGDFNYLTSTTQIELLASTPVSIVLSSDPTDLHYLATGGTELSTITVQIFDAYGRYVPIGTSVTLQASSGTFSNGTNTITHLAGAEGEAYFVYQSGITFGTITFTATSGTASAIAELLTVSFGPTTQILLSVDTAKAADLGNGSSSLDVAALISDENGASVAAGGLVAFDVTAGGALGQITPWATTNAEGVAEATLIFLNGNTGSTITVRATVGTVSRTLVITLP
jgi:adhesin/invasin